MTDQVFNAIQQRQLADLRAAVLELGARVQDLDDDPLDDIADYVTSPAARNAVVMAQATTSRPTPDDRSVSTLGELRDQLLADGVRLELQALEMGHPDYVNAHQGHAVGLQRAGLRLDDFLASHGHHLAVPA